MKKVTGIGGIFFKSKDPKALNEWYKTHLGFDTSPMEPALNGGILMTAQKRDVPNGILLLKTQIF